MALEDLQRNWDRLGTQDPLWAILTEPGKRHGRWDVAEFFESGRAEFAAARAVAGQVAAEAGLRLGRGRALDFGCGVGRITQALCEHVDRVDGVDVAASMVDAARRFNRYADRCVYHLNEAADLGMFDSETFDFAYCARVLQHMPPPLARGYVSELVRTLKIDGILFFQITTARVVGATGPLPASAFQASLRLLDPPAALPARGTGQVTVVLRNTSDHTWPAGGDDGWFLVTVGNHWSRPGGAQVVTDDGRARLPHDIPPDGSAMVTLPVTAPARPGTYRLEVDLCQEGIAWFADQGSSPATATVDVTGGEPWWRRRRRGHDEVEEEGRMDMHATPIDEVARWVADAGGILLRVVGADVGAETGAEWQSREFVVTR